MAVTSNSLCCLRHQRPVNASVQLQRGKTVWNENDDEKEKANNGRPVATEDDDYHNDDDELT